MSPWGSAARRLRIEEHPGSPELVAIIHPENEASEHVARKLGMHRLEDDRGGNIPVRTVLGMTFEAATSLAP